jgi:hypothetical protein
MKLQSKFALSLSVLLIMLALIILTRSMPSSQVWFGYRVLYVSSSTLSENQIDSVLKECGCKNVVSRSVQKIPVVSSFSPVQVQDPDSYLNRRLSFFTDKSGSERVYYIPDSESRQIAQAAVKLNSQQGTSAGTDGANRFPWITPIITLSLFALCLFFCRKKTVFMISSLFPVVYAWCNPFYTSAAAVCVFLIPLFMIQRMWGRRNYFKTIVTSPLIISFSAVPCVLLFLSSPLRSIIFIAAQTASVYSLFLLSLYEKRNSSFSAFSPAPILGARFYRLPGQNGLRISELCGIAILVLLFISLIWNQGMFSSQQNNPDKPYLPSPVYRTTSRELPGTKDFNAWAWKTITFPYRRLNRNSTNNEIPSEGDSVLIPLYAHSEKNAIIESQKEQYVYNDSFRKRVYRIVRSCTYPSIEQVLLKQGKNMEFEYTQNTGTSAERFSTLLLVLLSLFPICMTGYCLAGHKK